MNFSPFDKNITDLKETDLSVLIDKEISEGWYIEYKREVPKINSKLDNIKIAKSVSSFANTKGGWIFYGIETDDKNKPASFCGIDIKEFKNFEDQISQVINANISPKPYYHFKQITLENNKTVFIIKVEESPTPPYITSQGVIYQRENNESKPIKDRYIIEKLNEKTNEYNLAIERFSKFDLGETRGQSESYQTFIELFIFPLPFNDFEFKSFSSSEFFKNIANRFYQHINLNFGSSGDNSAITLNIDFNSIFSSDGSLIIRPLNENNLIYKSTTVELFKNGNLKFLLPVHEFDANNIPKKYKDSKTLEYILDKYSPMETVDQNDYRMNLGNSKYDLPPIKKRKVTDFVNHVKFIDGLDIIFTILIIIIKYKQVLKDNDFDFDNEIGFRIKIKDCWRKFVFFDNEEYLEMLKLYNIPLSPKNEINMPEFKDGNSYILNFMADNQFDSINIAKIILEGIGLPDSDSIEFAKIISNGIIKTAN